LSEVNQQQPDRPQPASQRLWIGLDVGGTKIDGAAVDDSDVLCGRVLAPTDTRSDAQVVESIACALSSLLAECQGDQKPYRVAGVGLGIPGQVENGTVSLAVNLNLERYPLARVLGERFDVPVYLENDVRAAALGAYDWARERYRSPVKDGPLNSMIYLSLGTGISAGVILDGRLHRGMSGMAGEVGHAIIDPDGALCKCGMRGCFETIAAGPAIARQAQERLDSGEPSQLRGADPLTAELVFAAASQGDALALAVVERVGAFVARAVYNLLLNYDVEMIALGGGVTRAGEPFFAPVQAAMARMCAESALAQEMLQGGEKVILLPGEAAPAWRGMILLARQMAAIRE
jgi:glucokinase